MKTYGLPQTRTKPTILVHCEGLEDKAFIKYLHDLFHNSLTDPRVNIVSGRGGTADGIVNDAIRVYGEYDSRVVVLDADKGSKEMKSARDLSKSKNLLLIEHTPCIEKLLLVVLSDKDLKASFGTGRCKKLFEKKYFLGKDRSDWKDYRSVFPKSLLKKQMKSIPELKILYWIVRGRIKKVI